MDGIEFEGFKSISRLNRRVVVTEKLDGTNAQVHVLDDGTVLSASRNRYIQPGDDGFGFAAWVKAREDELRELGPGRHFGEWWGAGIQRKYGLKEKRFSLFNVAKWGESRPACCHVVPVLWEGMFLDLNVSTVIERLRTLGSVAAPGFMNPEGIVIFHEHSSSLFKFTLDKNDAHKWEAA
jgi:hypothetical protein